LVATKKISTQKFLFSEEYREGVNDAFDEVMLFQKMLLDNEELDKCEKLYDKMVDLVYGLAEEFNIDVNWDYEWNIIYRIVYHVFKHSIAEFNQFRIIKSNLNHELIERTSRNGVSPKIRHDVFKRDCFKCRHCGSSPANDPKVILMIDHIQPITKGGKDSLDNYQTLCNYCNAGKGNNF
jgi:hypothetical protein